MADNKISWGVRLGAASILAAAAFAATPALAGSANANLGVSATVNGNCTISTNPVAFGAVDTLAGTEVDAAGSIVVTCTNGTAWYASGSVGTGTGATFASRKMKSGANLLNYTLYTDSGRTAGWGDGTSSTSLLTATGSGAAQTVGVYGRVFSGQNTAPAGSYSDTVSVTVTY